VKVSINMERSATIDREVIDAVIAVVDDSTSQRLSLSNVSTDEDLVESTIVFEGALVAPLTPDVYRILIEIPKVGTTSAFFVVEE
jgi:hypothetical protein